MRARLAFLAVLLLATGCSNRERLNPFDPHNPLTGGHPAGFAAVAGLNFVVLTWQPATSPGLLGYKLERRLDGETEYVALVDLIPASTTRYVDFGLARGVDHHYRLQFVFSGGPNGRPAEDVAAPGPQRPWVTDPENQTIVRLSPDARRIAAVIPGGLEPAAIAVDPISSAVWVCDTYGGRVLVVTNENLPPRAITGIPGPLAVAVDPAGGTAWVTDASNRRALHLNETGDLVPPSYVQPLFDPLSIAVDHRDRSVWVVEGLGNRVRRFDAIGEALWGAVVSEPSRVALDSLTGAGWVTSFHGGRIYVVSASGVVVDTLGGFRGPIGIVVDWDRDRVWVADALDDRVIALRRDGSVEFDVRGLSAVREIALDRHTGDVWAAVPGQGAVARISSDGKSVRKVIGLGSPYAIALDPGQ